MGPLTSLLLRGSGFDPAPSDETVVAECRRCGTSVEPSATRCSTCEHDEIVTYRIR